jgi:uncharacterized protein (TIGR00369 family)
MSGTGDREQYRKLVNPGGHTCFGCSPDNPSGLKMEFHTDGASVVSWFTVPSHLCGWNDMIHGGVIATIMDEIMSWASMCLLGRYILTRGITVDFLKPLRIGRELRAEGRVVEAAGGREARMEGLLFDGEGVLCARATGRFALFTREGLEKMGMFDTAMLDKFGRIFSS